MRTKAFQATDQFLQIAKQHHEKVYITSLLFMMYPLCWITLTYQYFAFNGVPDVCNSYGLLATGSIDCIFSFVLKHLLS